jgi:hypothetical protein
MVIEVFFILEINNYPDSAFKKGDILFGLAKRKGLSLKSILAFFK